MYLTEKKSVGSGVIYMPKGARNEIRGLGTCNKVELAYLAGLFDGEGCIMIVRRSPFSIGHKSVYHYLSLSLTMANQQMPELFQYYFGGSAKPVKKQTVGRQPLWRWDITHNGALGVLRALLPYLRLKLDEAELGIKFQLKHKKTTHSLKEEQLAEREKMRALMKSLKRKT